MVDNVQLSTNVGVGAVAATDDIAGVHYQRVKISWGVDGSAVDASASNPFPVTVVSTTALTPGTAAANLGKAEDAAHASGDVGVMALGVRQDTAAALGLTDGDYMPMIFDASGRLHVLEPSQAAIAASLSVLDDWDEADRAKVNLIVGQAGIAAGAGAVGVTVPRVTLASDDPAVALLGTIDADTGGMLTALQIMDDWDEADRAKVNPIVGQAGVAAGAGAVGATVQRMTLASDDPGVVALQLLDDTVIADDAAFTPASTKVGMAGYVADEASTDSIDEGDAGAARMTLDRKQIMTSYAHAAAGGATPYQNLNVNSTVAVVKGSAGKLYGIHAMNLGNPGAIVYLKFWDEASADIGSDTPVWTLPIPNSAVSLGAGFVFPIPDMGVQFANGICMACTGASAPLDETTLSSSSVIVNLIYA